MKRSSSRKWYTLFDVDCPLRRSERVSLDLSSPSLDRYFEDVDARQPLI